MKILNRNHFGPAIITWLVIIVLAFFVILPLAVIGGATIGIDSAIFLVIGSFVYFLPALIADTRHHRQRLPIYLLNLFLGWTVLGWIGALIWSATSQEASPSATGG